MKLPGDTKLEGTIKQRRITTRSVGNCGDAEDEKNRNEVKLNSTKPNAEQPSLNRTRAFHLEIMDVT